MSGKIPETNIPTRGIDWYRLLPRFWYQLYPTNRSWDAALTTALNIFGVENPDTHTCRVGPFEVWIANYPYAYGKNYNTSSDDLPMARTRRRLRRMVEEKQNSKYYDDIAEALKRRPI